MAVTVGVSNLATVLLFLFYLRPDWGASWSALDALAIGNGVFFFFGQWFSVQAVKAGDLVVHSSALGIKLFLVASLSIAIGLEQGSVALLGAVCIGALAIFFLAGGDLAGWQKHHRTVAWTLVGTLFFGVADVLTSWQAQGLGMARWLVLMMLGSGCCALVALVPQGKVLVSGFKQPKSRWILLGLGLLMGTQAVLINTAFSVYREPTVSNVVFSIRGLLAVLFLMLVQRRFRGVVSTKTFAGALLMLAALALAAFA